jgi:DNA-binding IclR family transcriptional regulator
VGREAGRVSGGGGRAGYVTLASDALLELFGVFLRREMASWNGSLLRAGIGIGAGRLDDEEDVVAAVGVLLLSATDDGAFRKTWSKPVTLFP